MDEAQTAKPQRRGRSARHAERAAPLPPDERAVWPGMSGGRYQPLSDSDVAQVQEAVMRLLEDIGFAGAIPPMIERVSERGGWVCEHGRLHFPRALVEDILARSRKRFVAHGQTPEHDLEIADGRVHFGSGGASPNIVDLDTGLYRGANLADLYDVARIVDTLPNIHFYDRSLVARDVEDVRAFDLNTAYAILSGTAKHVGTSITVADNVEDVVALFDTVAGGEGRYRKRPFAMLLSCHVVPPMRFAEEALWVIEKAIPLGMPVMLVSAGQAGATAPVKLAGTVAQAVAEALAGLVYCNLIDPEATVITGPKPIVSDLRTGAMCGGSGEQAIVAAATTQMARQYGIPCSVMAGISDSKIPDAQSGYEKGYTITLAAQAGCSMVTQTCGMQASLLGLTMEGYVIDNDMLGAILRTVRGIEVSDESLSVETIRDVVLGEGHYLGHAQTLENMTRDYLYPDIADRLSPSDWEEKGGRDIRDRARDEVRRILASHYPRHIDDATDRRLRERFPIRLPRERMAPAP
ncbi:MAG: trimethylamine methyltransferase family protein [Rhodospirillales bacterium]|nr:trimethylamine methyltransferase family protein [Rhodospirillales bacterium]